MKNNVWANGLDCNIHLTGVRTKQPPGTVPMAQQVRTRAVQARGPEFGSAEPMSKARHGPATPVTPTLGRWGIETGGLPGFAGCQLSSRFSEGSCPKGIRQSHSTGHPVSSSSILMYLHTHTYIHHTHTMYTYMPHICTQIIKTRL